SLKRRKNRLALSNLAGVGIDGDTFVLDRLEETYQGKDYCPCLWAHPNAQPNLLARYRVATNVPSCLRLTGENLPVLVDLPPRCPSELGWGDRGLGLRGLPFMVGGDVGAGRVLVAADHSIFINEMMLPDEIQNVEFSENCIRYLIGDGKRTRVLLVDEF